MNRAIVKLGNRRNASGPTRSARLTAEAISNQALLASRSICPTLPQLSWKSTSPLTHSEFAAVSLVAVSWGSMSDVESKTDAQWEKLAHSWVHAFITATKTSRLYGREHPALSDALEKIIQVSTPIWESYGTVKLEIRAEVLRVLNITTNHFSKPQDNPFFLSSSTISEDCKSPPAWISLS